MIGAPAVSHTGSCQQATKVQTTQRSNAQETSDERRRLRGPKLVAARLVYLALLFLAVGLFIAGIRVFYHAMALGSIGSRLVYNGAGETLIIPVPGMSAAEAGLVEGDMLLKVGAVDVHAWHGREELTRLILGPIGTTVALTVRAPDGRMRELLVSRDVRGIDQLGLPVGAYSLLLTVLGALVFLGYAIPALIIFARKADDWLAMFVSLTLIVLGGAVSDVYGVFRVFRPEWTWAANILLFLFGFAVVLLFYVFPDGRFVPPWARIVVPVAALWGAIQLLPPPFAPMAWPFGLGILPSAVLYGGGVLTQIYRYRRVSGVAERQQTKWVVFGMAVAVGGALVYAVPRTVFVSLQEPTAATFRYQLVGQGLQSLALLAFPIGLTFSILRYRLYDIDLIINRTLVYVPLTAILAGLLAVASDLSKGVVETFLGRNPDSSVILTTLIIVAAFDPIKSWLQNLVDKYFKEAPNPQKRLQAFGKKIEKRVLRLEEEDLLRQLLEETATAFQTNGAAIFRGDQTLFEAARFWDGKAEIRIPLATTPSVPGHGELALGVRKNGAGYSLRDRRTLEQVCQTVARAIEQDHPPASLSPPSH